MIESVPSKIQAKLKNVTRQDIKCGLNFYLLQNRITDSNMSFEPPYAHVRKKVDGLAYLMLE